ncbi:cobalamin biosynthesis protein CbiX [Marichromatium gracile]|uniref:sirohydrochlorin chelatase n=1 Tax=Marichromatium gracile TaxID=1048 RepID=UPI001F2DEA56|nr:CbiX/SirB N-terminal domain-containing protein [Marichromatium gracile]MCF1183045.1 cobalamin biosynthesis protein CbiX [Marichromatium gracile]
MESVLLLDNGSRRAAAVDALRRLAETLSTRCGLPIEPVSLAHADRIPADRLDGRPATLLEPLLEARLSAGARDFLILPLFFGPSAALTEAVPALVARLRARHGDFALRLAPELCPLPAGEPLLTRILAEQLARLAETTGDRPRRVILVDHGSPNPEVSAVRAWLAARLAERLGQVVELDQAVMERRPGAAYDFNGPLLEQQLERLAGNACDSPIFLSMLFLAPGRHAGPGGDIAEICTRAEQAHAGLRIHVSGLVGEHPLLPEILAARLRQRATHHRL